MLSLPHHLKVKGRKKKKVVAISDRNMKRIQ